MEEKREDFYDLFIQEYKNNSRRREHLFKAVFRFLIIDAIVFFLLLIVATIAIVCFRRDWHVLGIVLFPAVLGGVVALAAMKAVFSEQKEQHEENIGSYFPTSFAARETLRNLSGS